MNLENCVDNMGLEKSSTGIYSSRRNLLINKSYSNLSNNLLSAGRKMPTSQLMSNNNNNSNKMSCAMLVNSSSSHLNLYKSSNSLNALDLDLMESVSVGSFDRLSLYSCGGANSECDLNQCCYLVEMIDDGCGDNHVFNNNSSSFSLSKSRLNLIGGSTGGAKTAATTTETISKNNRTSKSSTGCFSLIDNPMSLSNLKENRVIDWLENI